jgi:hypothetical protein
MALLQDQPTVYQDINGQRVPVGAHWSAPG